MSIIEYLEQSERILADAGRHPAIASVETRLMPSWRRSRRAGRCWFAAMAVRRPTPCISLGTRRAFLERTSRIELHLPGVESGGPDRVVERLFLRYGLLASGRSLPRSRRRDSRDQHVGKFHEHHRGISCGARPQDDHDRPDGRCERLPHRRAIAFDSADPAGSHLPLSLHLREGRRAAGGKSKAFGDLTAVVLAGGAIYSDIPKPMVPVAGQPFLHWQNAFFLTLQRRATACWFEAPLPEYLPVGTADLRRDGF